MSSTNPHHQDMSTVPANSESPTHQSQRRYQNERAGEADIAHGQHYSQLMLLLESETSRDTLQHFTSQILPRTQSASVMTPPRDSASALDASLSRPRDVREATAQTRHSPDVEVTGDTWMEENIARYIRNTDHSRQTGSTRLPQARTSTMSSTVHNGLQVPITPPSERIRLTRRYTGRPHVPGEDSGSDTGEGEIGEPGTIHNGHATAVRDSTSSGLVATRHTADMNRSTEHTRQSSHSAQEVQSEMENGNLERRDRDTPPSPPTSYATSGPAPTRDSFYDWAPVRQELEQRTRTLRSGSRSRSRSRSQSSVRRWRPTETTTGQGPRPIILLDGRSDAHDQLESNREDSTQNSAQSTVEDIRTAIRSARTGPNTSQTGTAERSSEARRDLERALREYRIARRALRSQNHSQSQAQNLDDADRDNETGTSTTNPARRIWQSPRRFSVQPWQPQTGSDTNTSRATVHDVSNNSGHIDRHSSGARRLGEVDAAVPFSILSQRAQDAIEEQRRERQFIREWVRNRPRNHQQLRESAGQTQLDDNSLASGPLFNRDRDRVTVVGSNANGDRNSGDGLPRFSGDRYRRLVETYKRLKKAEEEQESSAYRKAKATIQYVSQLKECGGDQQAAWDLAMCLGLHSDGLNEDAALDLPLSAQALPTPTYTSWLEPGVVWKGNQRAGNVDEGARMLNARARRHRERMRREREERERVEAAQRRNENYPQRSGDRPRDPLERTILGTGSSFLSWSESMRVLEDAERRLSTMLDRQNERLRDEDGWSSSTAGERRLLLGDGGFSRRTRDNDEDDITVAAAKQESEGDRWNVKVTIHEIDWNDMTLTGTMSASQLPDRTRMDMGYQPLGSTADEPMPYRRPKLPSDSEDDEGMDSFFTGDIVDFRNHHTLHTSTSFGWKVGGLETDLSYWAGIGPFREEVEKEFEVRRAEKGAEKLKAAGEDKYCGDILSDEEKEEVKRSVMAKCLGSKKWLNRHLGDGEGDGWVLMRWKEQCFVTPGPERNPQTFSSSATSSASSATVTNPFAPPSFYPRHASRVWDTSNLTNPSRYEPGSAGNAANSAIWGLTISGFYYVALHRLTGTIEALYYDPGSQPYQRLKMIPSAEYSGHIQKKHTKDNNTKGSTIGMLMDDNEEEDKEIFENTHTDLVVAAAAAASNSAHSHGTQKMMAFGLRSAFPIIELR